MKYIIPKDKITGDYEFPDIDYPKYTSQLINWANQNAQSTRPRYVGQMSDLFPEFRHTSSDKSLKGWEKWYLERYPNAIDEATDKIYDMVLRLKDAMNDIDKSLVRTFVRDLIINKTYMGLLYQQIILQSIAEKDNLSEGFEVHETVREYGKKSNGKKSNKKKWRLSNPEEEAKGIDGYVDDVPYSIKSSTYKTMDRLPEQINVTMVYYKTNAKGDLVVEIEK